VRQKVAEEQSPFAKPLSSRSGQVKRTGTASTSHQGQGEAVDSFHVSRSPVKAVPHLVGDFCREHRGPGANTSTAFGCRKIDMPSTTFSVEVRNRSEEHNDKQNKKWTQ